VWIWVREQKRGVGACWPTARCAERVGQNSHLSPVLSTADRAAVHINGRRAAGDARSYSAAPSLTYLTRASRLLCPDTVRGRHIGNMPPVLSQLRGPVLATDVLHGFPIFECGLHRQKICMFAILRVLLDGSACPRKAATTCRAASATFASRTRCDRIARFCVAGRGGLGRPFFLRQGGEMISQTQLQ